MELKHSDIAEQSYSNYNIGRLQTWLDYELSGFMLLITSYFYFFTFYLAVIVAVVFTPFMLKVLYEEKRYGWLISFFLIIVLPPVMVYVSLDNMTWLFVALFTCLGLFYFYCGILRFVIPYWED